MGDRVGDEESALRILGVVVEEFERRQLDGAYRIMHRRARRWWERHGATSKQLTAWMSGCGLGKKLAREAIAAMMLDVKKIALLPLNSQWMEGAHAQVKQYTDSHRRSRVSISNALPYPTRWQKQ